MSRKTPEYMRDAAKEFKETIREMKDLIRIAKKEYDALSQLQTLWELERRGENLSFCFSEAGIKCLLMRSDKIINKKEGE